MMDDLFVFPSNGRFHTNFGKDIPPLPHELLPQSILCNGTWSTLTVCPPSIIIKPHPSITTATTIDHWIAIAHREPQPKQPQQQTNNHADYALLRDWVPITPLKIRWRRWWWSSAYKPITSLERTWMTLFAISRFLPNLCISRFSLAREVLRSSTSVSQQVSPFFFQQIVCILLFLRKQFSIVHPVQIIQPSGFYWKWMTDSRVISRKEMVGSFFSHIKCSLSTSKLWLNIMDHYGCVTIR